MDRTSIDLFCGIGGFHLGMGKAGFSTRFACDVDRHCRETYRLNYGFEPAGDIRRLTPGDLPEADVWCAGHPCQPFSTAGRRRGFEDARGTLFFEIARLARERTPPVLFLENVRGFASHDKGRTLEVVCGALEEIGYAVGWSVLDAADFGLPQVRERTVIVASRLGAFDFAAVATRPRRPCHLILEDCPEEPFLPPEKYVLVEAPVRQPGGRVFAGYLRAGTVRKGADPAKPWLSRAHRQPNRIWSAGGLYPTLSSQETQGRFYVEVGGRVRKLSLRECYRLMGFPDSFLNCSPVGQQRRQVGNAVCPPMVKAVASEIRRQLFGDRLGEAA